MGWAARQSDIGTAADRCAFHEDVHLVSETPAARVIAELIGAMLLIIFGDGVVTNVLLNKSKGQNSGWIVIATAVGQQRRPERSIKRAVFL